MVSWKKAGDQEFRPSQFKVYDISFLGLAFDRAEEISEGDELVVFLKLAEAAPFEINAQVVRSTEDKVAVQLIDLSGASHLAIDRFLKDKLVGIQMHLVTKKFYNPNESFDYWFHGPRSTNLLLWSPQGRLERAFFEAGEDVVIYENDHLSYRKSEDEARGRGFSYEYDIEVDKKSDQAPPQGVVQRFVQIIHQVEGHEDILTPFRQILEQQAH